MIDFESPNPVQAIDEGMRQRVAPHLHARRRHLAELRPGDVPGRVDQGRHDEEGGAEPVLAQDGEGLRVVARVAVVEGEAVEPATELTGHLPGGQGAPRRLGGREQVRPEVLAGDDVRPVGHRQPPQVGGRHDVVEVEDRRPRPHT
jgi:hypothetical protein